MSALITVLAVSLGAGFGAQGRYALDLAFARKSSKHLPVATLIANTIGSALIGVMVAVLNSGWEATWWTEAITAGFAGGLTTFSTLTAQVIETAKRSKIQAVLLAVIHVVLGFAAAISTWWVTLKFLG